MLLLMLLLFLLLLMMKMICERAEPVESENIAQTISIKKTEAIAKRCRQSLLILAALFYFMQRRCWQICCRSNWNICHMNCSMSLSVCIGVCVCVVWYVLCACSCCCLSYLYGRLHDDVCGIVDALGSQLQHCRVSPFACLIQILIDFLPDKERESV